MQIIQARTSTEAIYPIYLGTELLHDNNISEIFGNARLIIVTEDSVAKLHSSKLKQAFFQYDISEIVLPTGEQHKNWQAIEHILIALDQGKHDRYSCIVSLGGGVIGDLTGFVASIYMRGMKWINIPTTLLAQVDAAVGGKTGCNFLDKKNLIGSFYQPQAIIADTSFLHTLPEREFNSGLVEIIKYGMACDANFFVWLEQNINLLLARDESVLIEAIKQSINIKLKYVQADTQDHGLRRALNFGHTFGHAIEAITEYRTFLHGEAVAIGMLLATQLAVKLCCIDADLLWRLHKLLSHLTLPLKMQLTDEKLCALYDFIKSDKKKHADNLRFILPCSLGAVKVVDGVKFEYIEEIIENYASIFDHC